jgi:hypothetical protein
MRVDPTSVLLPLFPALRGRFGVLLPPQPKASLFSVSQLDLSCVKFTGFESCSSAGLCVKL